MHSEKMNINQEDFCHALLSWYGAHKRTLPWRDPDGNPTDPYRVWISEIMLQQTTVATVGAYYARFLSRWPTVESLSQASLDDVLHAWQGLGYYSRARNLHKCAKMVADEFGGIFPSTEKNLLKLPGVGPYTAAAIRSIAFNLPATVVDGNVERVIARLYTLNTPLPQVKTSIHHRATSLRSESQPSNYAQALMDLGASVCTPKSPKCQICPVQTFCQAVHQNPEQYPVRPQKQKKPTRHGTFYYVQDEKGRVLIEKRPLEGGLFSGLMAFPSTGWDQQNDDPVQRLQLKNIKTLAGRVTHVFTHFSLVGVVKYAQSHCKEGVWVLPEDLKDHALPTLMKKVAKLAASETVV